MFDGFDVYLGRLAHAVGIQLSKNYSSGRHCFSGWVTRIRSGLLRWSNPI